MSIKLMAEVWSKDLSASQQRVLLVLCDHANDQGINCYPSTDYIGWKLGVRRSTVSNTITELEKMGAIQVRRDHRKVNHYRIRLDRIPTKAPFAKAIYEVEEWGDDENLALENRTQTTEIPTLRVGKTRH